MSVLDRSDLEASPLADLHAVAGELGLDGYRRLRKADLIERIVERSGGQPQGVAKGHSTELEQEVEAKAPSPRRRRPSRRRRATEAGSGPETGPEEAAGGQALEERPTDGLEELREEPPARAGRGEEAPAGAGRGKPAGGRGRGSDRRPDRGPAGARFAAAAESVVAGVVEVLANGSAFLRPDPSFEVDGDVYVSAAQVRRCELDSGDRVSGPVRPARRSERHPSLVRVDTINGEQADAVADRPRFESLPAAFPSERLALGSEDPTLKAIEWLTPFGRGSRVAIVGGPRAGKTETLRRLLAALAGDEGLQRSLVLAGARPEEVGDWQQAGVEPIAIATLAASADVQGQTVERAVETAKRQVARGEHVLLAIDGLDGVPPHIARRALAAARNILDGGTLTVIATSSEPFGGETTVIALDVLRTSTGRLPALDLPASGTLKAELLVGEESAAEIVKARAEAAGAIG